MAANKHRITAAGTPFQIERCTFAALLKCLKPATKTKAAQLLSILRSRPGHIIPRTEIENALYDDDPRGGPLYMKNIVSIYLMQLRQQGYRVDTYSGRGLCLRPERRV